MPSTPHVERHFTSSDTVRDIVIGMSDGLTVPFALAAGLTGAIAQSRLIITAGFAEIAAGSIAMGLGGYLAARGDAEHYAHEETREYTEIRHIPEAEAKEVTDIFRNYGLSDSESSSVVQSLRQRPKDWVAFMMRFELGLEQPQPSRAWKSALTIALAYAVRWNDPAQRLPADTGRADGVAALGDSHAHGARSLWRSEGKVHGCSYAAERTADDSRRGTSCRCGIRDRPLDLLNVMGKTKIEI